MVELLVDQQTAWGSIQVGQVSSVRSYDGNGQCFSFLPKQESAWQYALDVERRLHPEETSMISAVCLDGLSQWVEIEVAAKLTATPAHIVFRLFMQGYLQSMLLSNKIEILHCDTESHWIAIGRRPLLAHAFVR